MKVEIYIPDSGFIQAMKQLSTVFGFKEYRMNVESDTAIIVYQDPVDTPHVCKCGEGCHCEHHHEETSPIPDMQPEETPQICDKTELEVAPETSVDETPDLIPESDCVETDKNVSTTNAKCPTCGKEFVRKAHNQTYCSIHCKRVFAYQKEVKGRPISVDGYLCESSKLRTVVEGSNGKLLKCPECGKEFEPTSARQIFCSTICRNSAKRKQLGLKSTFVSKERICPVCNKTFLTQRVNQKYCSHECKRIFELRAKKVKQQKSSSENVEDRQSAVTAFKPVVNVVKPSPMVMKPSTPTPVKIENDKPVFNFRCKLCDNLFQTTHKDQHFCNPCLDSFGVDQCEQLVVEEIQKKRMIEEAAKIRFKVCPKCGHTFEAKNPAAEFFCPKCVERAQRAPLLNR